MQIRRLSIYIAAIAFIFTGLLPIAGGIPAASAAPEANAIPASNHVDRRARVAERSRSRRAKSRRAKTERRKVCERKRGKRRCRWVQEFDGHAVGSSQLREEALPRPSGEIWFYVPNLQEEFRVNIYNEDGVLNEKALAMLDHGFRCKRTHEERAVDPRLYELLSIIYDHFGKQRLELVSGFRFAERDSSRHFHASAMDIRIPGVSVRELHAFAKTLDKGGMGIGIYPRSGFVHLDFRAPGERSYYWTDWSGPGGGKKRSQRRRRNVRDRGPNS